ncbi:MAG TPA: response regulator [Polyangiales bacterium]|nr:response regulator [Polyangiales bacterium]
MSVAPEDAACRGALFEQLADLRRSAAELGLPHLETALAEALARLEKEAFGPAALAGMRVLAWRYEALAAMPGESGTHPVVRERGSVEPSLRGRRVLVADDEAEVRWSYVAVLREASARVIEASDGAHALALAREHAPDVILADIVMPRLDGLGLCAAIRREPLLDGVPVVLLSWRDDFLHRMQELRVEAQGYLRKETPAREILQRVSRVLAPLADLEADLRSDRDVIGELGDLGVSSLLRAVRRLRPSANIVIQDPWSLFDLVLHEGKLVAVTRTAIDGAITRGAPALPALVGMSSGRFVVAKATVSEASRERASLDGDFESASRHLAAILNRMAEHPDCRIEFDEDVLGTCARHSPFRVQGLIERLAAGEAPEAVRASGAASRTLMDALLVTLARQGAIRDVTVAASTEIEPDSVPVEDAVERENVRAQSAVAMHRDPANRASPWIDPIWRLSASASAASAEGSSDFEAEVQTRPRLFGLAYLVALAVTVAFLIWNQTLATPSETAQEGPAMARPEPVAPPAPRPPPSPERSSSSSARGLYAFSGALRGGVDPSLAVADGQGVLELSGSRDVRIEVDGVERGPLPISVVLAEGTHAVRYRNESGSTYRFYFVKSGATRSLQVVTRPGGLVDPR